MRLALELYQLIQFKTIADLGNMTRAAEKLFISQPALSQNLSKLENELGIKLFNREKNGIYLNNAGKIALEYTNHILDQSNKMLNALKNYASENITFNIWSADATIYRFMVPLFNLSYPEVSIFINTVPKDQLLNALYDGSADLVIIDENYQSKDITSIPMCTEYLNVSVPNNHEYSLKDRISFRELIGQKILLPGSTHSLAWKACKAIKEEKLNIEFINYGDNFQDYHNMLDQTNLLSFVSSCTIHFSDTVVDYKPNNLRRLNIRLSDKEASCSYYLSYLKRREILYAPMLNSLKSI